MKLVDSNQIPKIADLGNISIIPYHSDNDEVMGMTIFYKIPNE